MADDAVLQILQTILDSLAALDRRIEAVDQKVTRQHAILTQDVRMIRAAIHDAAQRLEG